jgi:hypothetical protein
MCDSAYFSCRRVGGPRPGPLRTQLPVIRISELLFLQWGRPLAPELGGQACQIGRTAGLDEPRGTRRF